MTSDESKQYTLVVTGRISLQQTYQKISQAVAGIADHNASKQTI